MKKEDVRSEGERPNVDRRRFLGTVRPPHVFISFPRHGARHGVLTLDQTTCLVRFSVTSCTGPPHVVIRSTCHIPVPRLAARPLARARLAYFITATRTPL